MGAELHTRLEVRSSPTAASHVLCAGAAASVQAWSVASGMQPRKGRGLGSPRDDTALVPHVLSRQSHRPEPGQAHSAHLVVSPAAP